MKVLFTFMLACAVLPLFAERQPFVRYQSILDRQMFGVPPEGFDPTKPANEVSKSAAAEESAQQAQIRSAIRFSAINVTPGGETAVGFTDNSDSKNPVHYYLKVGESRNGWLVKEADPVKASMTIAKDEVEVKLTIGGDSSKSADGESANGRLGSRKARGMLSRRDSADAAQHGSLRGRRKLRERQRQAEAAEAAAEKAAEAARREEERRREEEEKAQREAEREEQRAQLLQIQEELRKARETRAAKEAERPDSTDSDE